MASAAPSSESPPLPPCRRPLSGSRESRHGTESHPVLVGVSSPAGAPPRRPIPTDLPPRPSHPRAKVPTPPLPPPVVYHISAPSGLGLTSAGQRQSLFDLLEDHTPLSRSLLWELADIGAVWSRVGPPHPRVSPRAVRVGGGHEASVPLPVDTPLYVRVHAVPRRHAPLGPVVLLQRIGDIAAVEKPAGVPVAPTNDNAKECVLAMAEHIVGVGGLRITSRLDVGTSGVVLLAVTKGAARVVNEAMKDERCMKKYRVLTRRRPPAPGVLTHWMRAAHRGRGVLKESLVREWNGGVEPTDDPGGWVRAELVVESVEDIAFGGGAAWESIVRLVTGRTHQIRMQFAAEGAPVVGDTMYEGSGGAGRIEAGQTLGDYAPRHGLHAASLSLPIGGGGGGDLVSISAGRPWWRATSLADLE